MNATLSSTAADGLCSVTQGVTIRRRHRRYYTIWRCGSVPPAGERPRQVMATVRNRYVSLCNRFVITIRVKRGLPVAVAAEAGRPLADAISRRLAENQFAYVWGGVPNILYDIIL